MGVSEATYDIVVIGGGIAGVSVTYELTMAGRKVLLVERESQLAYHTTGRSAALFLESYGPPIVRGLLSASRAFLEAAPTVLDTSEILTPRMSLFVAEPDDVQIVADMVAATTLVEDVGVEGAVDLCPHLRPEVFAAACLERAACSIDVMSLHHGWVRGALAAGAGVEKWYDVVTINRRTGGFDVTSDAGRTVSAGHVVLAAGAWTDVLGARAGARPLGLQPKRRTMAVCPTNAVIEPFGTHVSDVNEKYYWQPEGPNIQCSPADEHPSEPCDARPEELDIAYVIDEVNRTTTLNLRSLKASWAGLRTFAPDRTPVCGADPDLDGLWWLCGQGGWGIETSPAMAAAMCGLVTEGRFPDHVVARGVTETMMSPARFHA